MKLSKRFTIILLTVVPIIGVLVLCAGLSKLIGLGKCDFDSNLTSQNTKREFHDAVNNFARQHDLDLSEGGIICGIGFYSSSLQYRTPLHLSKYGIIYSMFLTATYDPYSRAVELVIPEQFTKTEDVLNHIDSLGSLIAEFEKTPQVDEFTRQFEQEGISLQGIILSDNIWIETDPSVSDTYADLFYSIPNHSIESYYLPSRITWQQFPEVNILYNIVNKKFLVDELSECTISTKRDTNARTIVHFYPEIPSTFAGVDLFCSDAETDKFIGLVLHPDGSYELDSSK